MGKVDCTLQNVQRPYTYVANVLVAVNPLRKVPDPPIESFKDASISGNQPHPYGIAEVKARPLFKNGAGGCYAMLIGNVTFKNLVRSLPTSNCRSHML